MINHETIKVKDVYEDDITNTIQLSEYKNLTHNELFSKSKEGVIFIINEQGNLEGVLTDGDIRRYTSIENDPLENYISWHPTTIELAEDATLALHLLQSKEINILSVVSKNKHIGYISLHKLLKYFSPERIYLDDEIDDNKERHISRYKFSLNFLEKNFKVLDCACGSGYGSELLSEQVSHVTGIDLSQNAIVYGKKHHKRDNINFIQQDIKELNFDKNSFDAIVSFETIEHIPKDVCIKYITHMKEWVSPGGVIILSSPMLRYKNGKPYVTNPYHINEMPKNELLEIFSEVFSDFILHYYHQKQDVFLPLSKEHTGFMILVARKNDES